MMRMDGDVLGFDGGALAWESAGDGPDVVFVHPGPWHGRVRDEQLGVFSRTYREPDEFNRVVLGFLGEVL